MAQIGTPTRVTKDIPEPAPTMIPIKEDPIIPWPVMPEPVKVPVTPVRTH